MSDVYDFIKAAVSHMEASAEDIKSLADSLPARPAPYNRMAESIIQTVYDRYKPSDLSGRIGPKEADSSIIEEEFSRLKATLPSKNSQSSEQERALEAGLRAFIDYAALINRSKSVLVAALDTMEILNSRGKALEQGIESAV